MISAVFAIRASGVLHSLIASGSDVAELVSKFSIMRASLPPLVLATPHDKLPAPWTTSSSPSQPVLLRLQLLARESLSLLEEKLSCPAPASPSSMDLKVREELHAMHSQSLLLI